VLHSPLPVRRRHKLLVARRAGAEGYNRRNAGDLDDSAARAVGYADYRGSGIYPSTDELPVNQLRLYVHFSSPMSEGWALRAVHVRRADNNQPLEHVFLEMEPELWDPARRRLTLLLDPGRIKRGLVPNEEAGYPLIEGVPAVGSIDASFRDASGQRLRSGTERRYEVGPPTRARVDPMRWQHNSPAAGSKDPLTVEFDRPLDHGLLGHSLWVHAATSAPQMGRATIGPSEQSWRFEPELP